MDTLPEEKIAPLICTGPSSGTTVKNGTEIYKRVYPDWKPSKAIEQTDVVGTIQAIAGELSMILSYFLNFKFFFFLKMLTIHETSLHGESPILM